MNHGWAYTDDVPDSAAGESVAGFYAKRYRHSPEEVWRGRCSAGEVELNGRPAAADDLISAGDALVWRRPPWEEPAVPLDFRVIHEDADVVAVDKPSGLPVLPDGGFRENTLLHLLSLRYPGESVTPVHRLGRGTSGILICARSGRARSLLSAQFRDETARAEGRLRKIYVAATAPCRDFRVGEEVRVETPVGPVPHALLGTVHAASPDGKRALSVCRVRETDAYRTLWEIELVTGRPHQIRIHLASIGHPLLGDPLFLPGGRPRPDALPGDTGYFLRAVSVSFRHPANGEPVTLAVPVRPEAGRRSERGV